MEGGSTGPFSKTNTTTAPLLLSVRFRLYFTTSKRCTTRARSILWSLTCVTALALGLVPEGDAGTGMDDVRLLDDHTVLLQLEDVTA